MLLSSSSITLTGPSSGGPDSVRRHLNNTIARVLTSFAPFPTSAATLQIPSPDRPIHSYLCFHTKAFPRKAMEAFADRYCHKCKVAQLSRSATVTEKPSRYLFVESVTKPFPLLLPTWVIPGHHTTSLLFLISILIPGRRREQPRGQKSFCGISSASPAPPTPGCP